MIPMKKTGRSLSQSDKRYIGNHTIDPNAIQLSQRQLDIRNHRRLTGRAGGRPPASPTSDASSALASEEDKYSFRRSQNKRSPRNLLRLSPRRSNLPNSNSDDLDRQRALVRSMMRRKESTPKEKSGKIIRNVLERALESTKKKPKDPPITPQRQLDDSTPVRKPKKTTAIEVQNRTLNDQIPSKTIMKPDQKLDVSRTVEVPTRTKTERSSNGDLSSSIGESQKSLKGTPYREFLKHLSIEASGSHSYLSASMETAVSRQAAQVAKTQPKSLNSTTREKVASMNSYLKTIPCERHECQVKQSVSDRDYDKARKKTKSPPFSTTDLIRATAVKTKKVGSEATSEGPRINMSGEPTKPLTDDQSVSMVFEKQQVPLDDRPNLPNKQKWKSEKTRPPTQDESKDCENAKIQPIDMQPEIQEEPETKVVKDVEVSQPPIVNLEVSRESENRSKSFPCKSLQSRKIPPSKAPAWTKIQLKPIKREQTSVTETASNYGTNSDQARKIQSSSEPDDGTNISNVHNGRQYGVETHEIIVVDPVPEAEPVSVKSAQTNWSAPTQRKTFNEYPTERILLSLPLQKSEGHVATRVVLCRQTIRCILKPQDDTPIEDCIVVWIIDRDEIEPDGINLSMAAFCIVMLLTNGEQVEILFLNSEDCLRFVSAFYDAASVPPEVSESVSVNSSVRVESLNDEEQSVLERYRELRQTRPPMKAMALTLTEDNTVLPKSPEPNESRQGLLQQLLLQKSSSQETENMAITATDASRNGLPEVVSAPDLPSSPLSTFTSTSVGKTVAATLNEAETAIADKYLLMLRRGVPIGAVEHSLKKDGVDSKIASAVRSMNEESEKSAQNTEEVATIVKKYMQMLKMGVPNDAVRHRMVKDGVEETIMTTVLSNSEDHANSSSDCTFPSRKTSPSTLSPSEEAEVMKYRKLLRLQVSRENLLARMRNEKVDDKVIEAVLGKNALTQEKSKKVSGTSTSSKLINLHWNAMDDVPDGSVWQHCQSSIKDVPAGSVWQQSQSSIDLEKSDINSLVEQFQKKPSSATQGTEPSERPSVGGKVKLLDVTRANNVAISLKAFKDFSYKELAEIIGFLDPCRKVLGERAQFVRDLLPTPKEAAMILKYQGPDDRLGPAELWFKQLQGIKRIDSKAQVIRTMEFFSSEVSVIRNNFKLLSQVCNQIQRSTKLVDVLKMVLKVGNTMNEGTRSGNAAGFRFDSLLRLTQTKTTDGKMSVLDYIVSVFVEKGQREKLRLVSDFPELHTVSRFLIVDMQNEVKTLADSLSLCKKELNSMENDFNTPAKSTEAGPNSSACKTTGDPRSALFASIIAQRNRFSPSDDETIQRSEIFSKRDDFLAAIDSKRKASASETSDCSSRRTSNSRIENNFQGGVTRLRQFIDSVDESFSRLQKQKDEALQHCKDLAKYCGETAGLGATGPLLDTLSKFTRNVESALAAYDERQLRMSARKKKGDDKPSDGRVSLDERSTNLPEKDGRSLVLMVNDVLKSANHSFKEDFKKGRKLSNPSDAVKAIYEKEATVATQISSPESVRPKTEWDCNGTAALTTSTVASSCQSTASPSSTNCVSSPSNTEVIGAALEVIKTRATTEELSAETKLDEPPSNMRSLSARALHKRQQRSQAPKVEEAETDQPNAGESSTARLARMKRIQMRTGNL